MSWGAGRRDSNEATIVSALVKAGCDIDYADRKPYDIVVGKAGKTFLLEIKSLIGKRKPKKKPLTDSQRDFSTEWRGHYAIVATVEEALKAVGL